MEHEALAATQNGAAAPPSRAETARKQSRQREQASLEQLLWRAHLIICALIGVLCVYAGTEIWQELTHRPVNILIHQVQVDKDGEAHPVGIPLPPAQWHPHDAEWRAFLLSWIRLIRPRSGEPVSTQRLWQVAAEHTCEQAIQDLNTWEKREQPFAAQQPKLVTVDQVRLTKFAPNGWHATWRETTTAQYRQTTEDLSASFRVGRRPATVDNPRGICVAWFDWPK